MMNIVNRWIFKDNKKDASSKIIFFHHAGGTASFYNGWSELFPRDIEVCAVQLPMRANRIREDMPESIEHLARNFMEENVGLFDKPFVLFGHSMGAQIAFEVSCQLGRKGITPQALFVSACEAPLAPAQKDTSAKDAEESEIIQILKDYGYMADDEILNDPDFRSYYIPIARQDFYISERYFKPQSKILSCPIYSLTGTHDPFVTQSMCQGWQGYTDCTCTFVEFLGDHFYLVQQKEKIAHLIGKVCRKAV